jgi:hypothetical protein
MYDMSGGFSDLGMEANAEKHRVQRKVKKVMERMTTGRSRPKQDDPAE